MPHPHGQIYGYSVMPLKLQLELNSCKEYYEENNECLICRMNKEEKEFQERIIMENEDFLCYLPFLLIILWGIYSFKGP